MTGLIRRLLLGVLALCAACSRGPRTPEEAYGRLSEAVKARDGGRLFDALDLETRWSWMSVQRAHREAHDITLSNFPEGTDRERQLKRFEVAAQAESPRDLFARQVQPEVWADLEGALGGTPRAIGPREAEVTVAGKRLLFRKDGGKWGWGWAGLAEQAEEIKKRAIADLDLIRASAADYERAATRGAK